MAPVLMLVAVGSAVGAERWWSDAAEKALSGAGTNRAEIVRALTEVSAGRRDGMQFLVEHMPAVDLQSLSAQYLLDNVTLAYDVFEKSPWARRVPKEIFLNHILPYASLNERRDNWRQLLIEKCTGMVTNCATPSEAAQALNRKLFKAMNVKYSTERRRADQGPLETMQSGIATCTGLSILLVDACRAMGVPARVVATPLWSNNRGNHTWIEIWDGGWHFTGAAEPDPKGLNRGWFLGEASQAQKDVPRHAIYASSFAQTGLSFPMVWARNIAWVHAENVTDRYTAGARPADTNKVVLEVHVVDKAGGKRVAAPVTVVDLADRSRKFEGRSREETADRNDILPFTVQRGRSYEVAVEKDGRRWLRQFSAGPGTNRQSLLQIALNEPVMNPWGDPPRYQTRPVTAKLREKEERKLRQEVASFFLAESNLQARWKFSRALDKLLTANEPAVRRAVWETYQAAPFHAELKKDFETNHVRFGKYVSPYTVKSVGTRPAGGWALFIAMHGGGNAPKQLNDNQWKHMQIYYRDQPEAGGYVYVALRAPNDTWNGFYDVYVYPLVANLIRQFVVLGDVDPNKVFIMGYSHGGYGAYAIGPKMPDRFAAIHASAAAATDGESTAKTLRNTIFTVMVGEKDTMYGRFDRNKKFKETVEQLRGDRRDIYPVHVDIVPGFGHGGLPDRDLIRSMYPAVRNPVPTELTWLQTDKVITDFFWLHTPAPAKKQELNASIRSNRVTVTTTTNVTAASLLLDSRLVDFSKPVAFEINGRAFSQKLKPSLRVLCDSLRRRGDIELAFTARVELPIGSSAAKK